MLQCDRQHTLQVRAKEQQNFASKRYRKHEFDDTIEKPTAATKITLAQRANERDLRSAGKIH